MLIIVLKLMLLGQLSQIVPGVCTLGSPLLTTLRIGERMRIFLARVVPYVKIWFDSNSSGGLSVPKLSASSVELSP